MLDDLTDAERIVLLEEDNRRLRRLLDQRDAPEELRHRTRSTLSVLRAIITKMAETNRDIDDYVAHLRDRVSALGRAQAAIDQDGLIDVRKLVTDELLTYGVSEGERATIEGPTAELSPKAGMTLAVAIHELAVNAVEHGAIATSRGRIDVSWHLSGDAPNKMLLFTWKERDVADVSEPSKPGFGTEVLTRMLPYELKADVSLCFEPDGIRCSLRVPLPTLI